MSTKVMLCLMMAVCTLTACDKMPAEKGEAVKAPAEAPVNEEATPASAYVCPAVSALTRDWAPAAEDTFALSLKLPEGFEHQTPEGPGTADFLKSVTLSGSQQTPPHNQRDYRISFTQLASTTDIRDKGEYKPYKMGTGFGEDGNRDEQMNLLVGDLTINGRSMRVLRTPGDSSALFDASFEEGGKFYVYKLAVSLNTFAGPDLDAAACAADLDKLGLDVLKSAKLAMK